MLRGGKEEKRRGTTAHTLKTLTRYARHTQRRANPAFMQPALYAAASDPVRAGEPAGREHGTARRKRPTEAWLALVVLVTQWLSWGACPAGNGGVLRGEGEWMVDKSIPCTGLHSIPCTGCRVRVLLNEARALLRRRRAIHSRHDPIGRKDGLAPGPRKAEAGNHCMLIYCPLHISRTSKEVSNGTSVARLVAGRSLPRCARLQSQ